LSLSRRAIIVEQLSSLKFHDPEARWSRKITDRSLRQSGLVQPFGKPV
jgi:hypothetical protein